MKKRVEAHDANALHVLGNHYATGSLGFQQDWNKALELYTHAAELGSSAAHYDIGVGYIKGQGIEIDKKIAKHYFELAAMAGHEYARHINTLSLHEYY